MCLGLPFQGQLNFGLQPFEALMVLSFRRLGSSVSIQSFRIFSRSAYIQSIVTGSEERFLSHGGHHRHGCCHDEGDCSSNCHWFWPLQQGHEDDDNHAGHGSSCVVGAGSVIFCCWLSLAFVGIIIITLT